VSEIESIEEAIVAARVMVERAEALNRLKNNKDFKAIILDHYGVQYASDLVRTKVEPFLQADKDQKYIEGQLLAIGHLSLFMNTLLQQGLNAKDAIQSQEEELEYLRKEELIND